MTEISTSSLDANPETEQKSQKKALRKFYSRALVLLIFFGITNSFVVSLFSYHIMSQDYFMWRWKYAVAEDTSLDQKSYDVLWLGDSRLLGGLNPVELTQTEEGEKLPSMVNFGCGGMQFPAIYFLLKRYLESRSKDRFPKKILLSQAPYAWRHQTDFMEHQLKFVATPSEFLEEVPWFWSMGESHFFWEYPLFCLKSVYSFNPEFRGSLFKRSAHNHQVEKELEEQSGFRSWSERSLQPFENLYADWKFEPHEFNLYYLDQIIGLCQQHQIPLVFFSMPFPESRLKELQEINPSFLKGYLDLLDKKKELGLILLEEELTPSMPDQYFSDWSHLNTEGAKVYTQRVRKNWMKWFKN